MWCFNSLSPFEKGDFFSILNGLSWFFCIFLSEFDGGSGGQIKGLDLTKKEVIEQNFVYLSSLSVSFILYFFFFLSLFFFPFLDGINSFLFYGVLEKEEA